MSESDHFIQDTPKRPDIRLLVIRLFLANFWRQVVWSSYCCLGTIIGVLEYTSYAKITDFDLAALCHKDILCLEITVKDFSVMNMFYSECHLDEPVKNLILRVAD